MAYKSIRLSSAIEWKFSTSQGVCTSDGYLTQWPESLGKWPSNAKQKQWVEEYEAYLASSECKDAELQTALDHADAKALKALVQLGIKKKLWTLKEFQQQYRSL